MPGWFAGGCGGGYVGGSQQNQFGPRRRVCQFPALLWARDRRVSGYEKERHSPIRLKEAGIIGIRGWFVGQVSITQVETIQYPDASDE
jgi:hypothetical protein